jgi:hypothetical protein
MVLIIRGAAEHHRDHYDACAVSLHKGGATMTYAQRMSETHAGNIPFESSALVECVQACFDCAQACTACADACLGEEDVQRLTRCIRLDLDCADVCLATGSILSRQTAFDMGMARAMLQACATACKLCGDECEHHAQHGMQHCAVCAEACRRCEQACNRLLATA